MSCITKHVMRWGLIGGLALGGLTLLVGPERVAAGLAQVRVKCQDVVDHAVDDPVALRRQLEQLAEEYPDRIAEVRGEMAEVDHQIAQVTRDVEIAARVVAYTAEDLHALKGKIDKAESVRFASDGTKQNVFIRFEGLRYTLDEAYGEAARIGNIRTTYKDRVAVDQQQLTMLGEQKERLHEILQKLEDDHATYQSQLWALDRQIDAIARNDRLIEMMEEQQETLASYNKYERVGSVKTIQGKLAEMRAVQEAQMEALRKTNFREDYESKARVDLDEVDTEEFSVEEMLEDILDDIEGDDAEPTEGTKASASVAWAEPIIID